MSRGYKLNSEMSWNFTDPVPDHTPVWVLVEEDTCAVTQRPSVFRAIYNPNGPTTRKLKMLDYDPEKQEDAISSNTWEIIAWRPMTDHGNTADQNFKNHGVTEHSNWTMTLDAMRDKGWYRGEADARIGRTYRKNPNDSEFWWGYREGYTSVTRNGFVSRIRNLVIHGLTKIINYLEPEE